MLIRIQTMVASGGIWPMSYVVEILGNIYNPWKVYADPVVSENKIFYEDITAALEAPLGGMAGYTAL